MPSTGGAYINRRLPPRARHDACLPLAGPIWEREPNPIIFASFVSVKMTIMPRSHPKMDGNTTTGRHRNHGQFDNDLSNGLTMLDNGDVDLIGISAQTWYACEKPEHMVVSTAIPRRDENHILVADDRPHHLPHKSIILAENRLQRRQLRRYRADFRVLDPMAFADMASLTPNTDSKLAFQSWMEDLRATKIITGYVTERHLFSLANVDARRHMLQTNSREGATRFIPSPSKD